MRNINQPLYARVILVWFYLSIVLSTLTFRSTEQTVFTNVRSWWESIENIRVQQISQYEHIVCSKHHMIVFNEKIGQCRTIAIYSVNLRCKLLWSNWLGLVFPNIYHWLFHSRVSTVLEFRKRVGVVAIIASRIDSHQQKVLKHRRFIWVPPPCVARSYSDKKPRKIKNLTIIISSLIVQFVVSILGSWNLGSTGVSIQGANTKRRSLSTDGRFGLSLYD